MWSGSAALVTIKKVNAGLCLYQVQVKRSPKQFIIVKTTLQFSVPDLKIIATASQLRWLESTRTDTYTILWTKTWLSRGQRSKGVAGAASALYGAARFEALRVLHTSRLPSGSLTYLHSG